MDPNAALAQLRQAIQDTEDYCCAECGQSAMDDVVTLFQGLDQWLSKGGFLPAEWGRRQS